MSTGIGRAGESIPQGVPVSEAPRGPCQELTRVPFRVRASSLPS
jgi:hypothetical protein